jgi:cell division septation protein DedD
MAEVDFDSYDTSAARHRSAQMSHMINLAGAACSIALVVGLGLWGYKLAVRDVNGVPVIRALAGPMREMPQSPGGDVALHQGLSVNAVAAVGTAAALPDQVLLAPAPVDLASEDAPGLGVALDPNVLPQVEVGTSAINPVALSAFTPETFPSIDTDAAVALALADALAVGVEPFAEFAAASLVRPKPRPSKSTTAAALNAPATPTPTTKAAAEIDPATLAVGTRLVQLGAFDNDADARTEWVRLQTQFGDLLAEKSIVVQAAQSGGRTFYRLRAHGFAGENDARQFCATLVDANTPCIPTLHR